MAQAWVTRARVIVARGGARLGNNPPAVPHASLILEGETASECGSTTTFFFCIDVCHGSPGDLVSQRSVPCLARLAIQV
jgi:hypothetical protein